MSPRVLFCLSVAALAVAAVRAEDSEAAEAAAGAKEFVLTLDISNFTEVVSEHDLIVVEFYAPWCGHCKKLAPEYEKAAEVLSSHDPPIVLAKVDASDESNKDLATKYELQGFPTIKILRNGGKVAQEYKGPREADGIVEYLKMQTGPASAEIKSAEDAGDLASVKNIVVVGVFPEFSGSEYENFIAVAEKLRSDYAFRHTLEAKHLPRGESSVSGPVVRLFKPFDELFVDSKDFDVNALEKFIEESSIPTVTIFDKDPINHPYVVKFFNNPNAKALLLVNFSSDAADTFKSKYQAVAEQYKGQGIVFLFGDLEAGQEVLQYFGLKEEQAPFVIVYTDDGQKYLNANLEPDHIAPWLKQYKAGEVKPFRKSEPIPEVNDEPVKVVVADSLQDLVFNSGKNVLLEFYAPWCGHCKKLAPILDEVAVSYEGDSDVVIAKLDATANDFPIDTFDVKGFPTLYFRSASGNLVQYDGGREKEDIIDFIEKNRDKSSAQEASHAEASQKDEL